MSTKRHHAEWLSLVESSGPFLSIPVLGRVFPQGLEAHDPDVSRTLRMAYEEWEENPSPEIHYAWVRHVLEGVLELPEEVLAEGQAIPQTLAATVSEHGETLRPDFAVADPDTKGKHRLLVKVYPPEQELDRPVRGRTWKASPATRMMDLLHAVDVRLGLVTNGEWWMLVNAPKGETTGLISWYASLWLEEPLTLRAFRSLLGGHRFFAVAAGDTLEAMLDESAANQQEVTDQLGFQVRSAVEILIQSLDRADQDHGRELLRDVPVTTLYEAALTVMMRLVFLFSAEERKLLLLGDPLYDQCYAVSTLESQLQEDADQHTEDVLERRLDAWVRLLTTFRAVYGGVQHERMKLPPYAGGLFDPDRFPFLEGRRAGTSWVDTPATPLPVNNRTVLHMLRSLQYLQTGGEAQRLSFTALDIEQIGHVYEGLLDHTARRADEPVLGLVGSKEPEIALSTLEAEFQKGEKSFFEFLKDATGSTRKWENYLNVEIEASEASPLRAACGNDESLYQRIKPFAGLVRDDSYGGKVVVTAGSVYVTEGTDRRSSGTHYTPKSLTEPIVQHTLEPLVYIGPAEGTPKDQWQLRPARELLDLKICDMACGSGAFLVQACRYLSELLVEAWERAEAALPGEVRITPYGEPSEAKQGEQPIPLDAGERLVYAHRIVAQRCLYGVDKNPLAIEMAKLSLWLLTLAKDKPFTFLDHSIRSGDSLVGISSVDQLLRFSLSEDVSTGPLLEQQRQQIEKRLKAVTMLRKQIEEQPSNTPKDIERKTLLLKNAEEQTRRLTYAADLLLAESWQSVSAAEREEALNSTLVEVEYKFKDLPVEQLDAEANKRLRKAGVENRFHWPMEFPEVFERCGFDAFIGNPPFMGGKKISGALTTAYLNFLKSIFSRSGATTDLCAYFLRRAFSILRREGVMTLLATNTIAEGDTRDASLGAIVDAGGSITRAVRSQKWPGVANLAVSPVTVVRGDWRSVRVLDGMDVPYISPMLTTDALVGKPPGLKHNAGHAWMGTIILGAGFVLSDEESTALRSLDAGHETIIARYMNGDDLANRPDMSPSRWVINFGERTLAEAQSFSSAFAVVKERVKPQRDKVKRKRYRELWWQFAEPCHALYRAVAGQNQVLVCGNVSKYLNFAVVPKSNVIFTANLFVFDLARWGHFSVLQSNIHELFARLFSPTLENRLSYSPRDAFDPFPFPAQLLPFERPLTSFESSEQEGMSSRLDVCGWKYHECRSDLMLSHREGLTKTYNRFHDSEKTESNIQKLRHLHVEMDQAVAAAYGWDDLDLGHDFHETKQGVRFTISEPARREVLQRLLKLNHERYAEEVEQGLHDKKKGKGKKTGTKRGRSKKTAANRSLFDDSDEDEPSGGSSEASPAQPAQRIARRETKPDALGDGSPADRPASIDEYDTAEVMAAFRQVARNRGWMEREEMLREVAALFGYQRLGPRIKQTLKGHMRAAIRRGILEADGENVRAWTTTMDDYALEALRETLCSVMRKGTTYEREDVIHAVAHHLGFTRVTETVRAPIKSAINSAIRQGILGYEGSTIWREA